MRTVDYDREKAVAYAHRWAFDRNPNYLDFENLGGDCTNFASQSLFAGAGQMNYKPVFGWFYIDSRRRTASWTGVEFLRNFLVDNTGEGPFAEETDVSQIKPGDIVQLSFDGMIFRHSPVVVQTSATPEIGNILIAAHTFDADNRPLSSYSYRKIRFLHIKGVRKA